ncbi:uncharacterized protein Z520_10958 [Fonsecaea multimorphosa CBS 102226]|uniref:Uncharacterized protein n=1 Tax=Fonsecaea multimorphosa CBS 102226 TaxID=1442371 RepID=A0A0D2GUU4_9EURO|nr:uncharacterized protein Z520_10958 [Fonsecaea multimorphosa CBS 102226]KIX93315.1 hypothetical protein Z520_10958 [Fonsecaea multimorphosa CBS 102226]OAL18552.1 hypothetical protein AYO22_10529 [Fonsecaea multimorphosa]
MAVSSPIKMLDKRSVHVNRLASRQGPPKDGDGGGGRGGGMGGSAVIVGIVAAVGILLTACVVFYIMLRRWRVQGKKPKYIPTKFLKSKWQTWQPAGKYKAVRNRELTSTNTAYNGNDIGGEAGTGAGVDRNTSVRSVMTLPAYSRTPKDTEQVIGREGERAGMDTVVEFPETADEEETRREDQMESLYQIRLARRREIAEREERRRERREARERGDTARLEELRRESRQRANESTASLNGGVSVSAATLIAEHQSRGRERRVSSVAYAALGEVRHDGTRIRANSNDSERGGLLSGAAPMGEAGGRPRLLSDATSLHSRERSNSAVSVSTMGSDMEPQPTPGSTIPDDTHRRQSDEPQSGGTSNSSPTANRFTPDESTGSDDIGESRIPLPPDIGDVNQPPDYEFLDWGDAPSYEAAVARRAASNASRAAGIPSRAPTNASVAPQLPQLNLPRIRVSGATEPNTPVSPEVQSASASNTGDTPISPVATTSMHTVVEHPSMETTSNSADAHQN